MSMRLAPSHYSPLLAKHPPRCPEDVLESGEVSRWTNAALLLYGAVLGLPVALVLLIALVLW